MKYILIAFLSLLAQRLLAQNIIEQVETRIDSAFHENNVVQRVDSLGKDGLKIMDKISSTVDSTMNHKSIDSLRQDGHKVMNKISSTADSINHHTDVEGKVNDRIEKVEQELKKVEQELKDKLKDNKAVQKVEGMDAVIDRAAPVDLIDRNQLDISEKVNLNADLPLDIPGDQLNGKLSLPNEHLNKIKTIPQNAINEVKSMKEVQKTTEYLNEANGIQQQASSYGQEVKALSEGDLDKVEQIPSSIEQRAQGLEEIQELQKQAGQVEQIKQMPDQYKQQAEQYQDQEYLKQQAKAKLIEKSIDHFAGRDEVLQKAMQQLRKLKKKYESFNTITGEAKKINSLEGTPLKERLVFGSTMQIHQGPPTAFDIGLTLAYRFNKRLSSGTGISYRFVFEDSRKIIDWDQHVYGGRIFTDYRVIKSFFFHGEFETLKTLVPVNVNVDDASRQWVNGALAGIGKTYQVKKKIKGNVLFMYNFLHSERSPYDKPWVIRFGFVLD